MRRNKAVSRRIVRAGRARFVVAPDTTLTGRPRVDVEVRAHGVAGRWALLTPRQASALARALEDVAAVARGGR